MKQVTLLACFAALFGCSSKGTITNVPPAAIDRNIREYYVRKYPEFAQIVAIGDRKQGWNEIKQADELRKRCPVDYIKHSRPGGPLCTYVERTQKTASQMTVTTTTIYGVQGGSRVVIDADVLECREGISVSLLAPISGEDMNRLLSNSLSN